MTLLVSNGGGGAASVADATYSLWCVKVAGLPTALIRKDDGLALPTSITWRDSAGVVVAPLAVDITAATAGACSITELDQYEFAEAITATVAGVCTNWTRKDVVVFNNTTGLELTRVTTYTDGVITQAAPPAGVIGVGYCLADNLDIYETVVEQGCAAGVPYTKHTLNKRNGNVLVSSVASWINSTGTAVLVMPVGWTLGECDWRQYEVKSEFCIDAKSWVRTEVVTYDPVTRAELTRVASWSDGVVVQVATPVFVEFMRVGLCFITAGDKDAYGGSGLQTNTTYDVTAAMGALPKVVSVTVMFKDAAGTIDAVGYPSGTYSWSAEAGTVLDAYPASVQSTGDFVVIWVLRD